MSYSIITAFAGVCLVISLLIETSSWWLKGVGTEGQLGLIIARSNIYLYFGRFFTLLSTASFAYMIERGASVLVITEGLALSLFGASVSHLLLLRGTPLTWKGIHLVTLVLLFEGIRLPEPKKNAKVERVLLMLTALSSFTFMIGLSVPLLLAIAFPQYRLSLSYTSQLLNMFGTLLLLFYVDQRMFRALDSGALIDILGSYTYGRALAFLAAALACFLFGIAFVYL